MLTVYTMEQSDQWDSIVRSFQDYDTYWLSGYVKAFELHGDGIPLLFYYENGTTRGINVAMKRDIASDDHFICKIEEKRFYDLATPYGYGGWIIEGNQISELFNAYQKWINDNNIVSEFVRFHPLIKNHEKCRQFYEVFQLGEVVHMNLSTPLDLWNNFTSKNRNMIRKAIKNGVKIYNGRFPEIYERFRTIYNETMDNNCAELYYYFEPQFYTSLLEDLSQNAQIFWAEKDSQIIAASIILAANKKMNYHLSGSLSQFKSFAPTNLILYNSALWGLANGYKSFYLGGGIGSGDDSLFKFKRAFYKGDLNHFFIGKKIFDKKKYDYLVNLRSELNETDFFPKYRG